MSLKDLKFITFTDLIEIRSIGYHSIVMKDGTTFIYKGLETQDIMKNYGYDIDLDVDKYLVRMELTPTARYIDEVRYGDDIQVSFTTSSPTIIHTHIPVSIINPGYPPLSAASYIITTSALTANNRVDMDFSISQDKVSSVSGALKLSQQVIKILLSKMRTNRYSLAEGTGLTGVLGSSVSPVKLTEILTESLEATQDFIIKKQSLGTSIFSAQPSLDDKLRTLTLGSINVDPDNPDRIEATINMKTSAGSDISIPIII